MFMVVLARKKRVHTSALFKEGSEMIYGKPRSSSTKGRPCRSPSKNRRGGPSPHPTATQASFKEHAPSPNRGRGPPHRQQQTYLRTNSRPNHSHSNGQQRHDGGSSHRVERLKRYKSLTYRKKTGACKKEWLAKTTKTNRQGKI
ncbi:hypothetical protein ACOMHN_038880 [Nucella lapillus]